MTKLSKVDKNLEKLQSSEVVSNKKLELSYLDKKYFDFCRENFFEGALFCLIRKTSITGNKQELLSFIKKNSASLNSEANDQKTELISKIYSRFPFDRKNSTMSVSTFAVAITKEALEGARIDKLVQVMALYFEQNGLSFLALDSIKTAMLLAAENKDLNYTLSQIYISLGHKTLAIQAAENLKEISKAKYDFLHFYIKICFQPTGFINPAGEFLFKDSDYGKAPVTVLKEIRHVQAKVKELLAELTRIRLYMLKKIDPELLSESREHEWIPKDYSELFDHELLLRKEQQGRSLHDYSLPDLIKEARSVSRCVSTICWSVGYNEICVPNQILLREDFEYFVPEAYARQKFMSDLEKNFPIMLTEFNVMGKNVLDWNAQLIPFIESDNYGLTESLKFLCNREGMNLNPVDEEFFFDFYKKSLSKKAQAA